MSSQKVEEHYKVLTLFGDSAEDIATKLDRMRAQGWYPLFPIHRGYAILLERGCPDNIKVVEND